MKAEQRAELEKLARAYRDGLLDLLATIARLSSRAKDQSQ